MKTPSDMREEDREDFPLYGRLRACMEEGEEVILSKKMCSPDREMSDKNSRGIILAGGQRKREKIDVESSLQEPRLFLSPRH